MLKRKLQTLAKVSGEDFAIRFWPGGASATDGRIFIRTDVPAAGVSRLVDPDRLAAESKKMTAKSDLLPELSPPAPQARDPGQFPPTYDVNGTEVLLGTGLGTEVDPFALKAMVDAFCATLTGGKKDAQAVVVFYPETRTVILENDESMGVVRTVVPL